MIEKRRDLLALQGPGEPLHIVLHKNLHRRAIDRPRSLDGAVDPATDRHMGAEKNCRLPIADCRLLWREAPFSRGSFHLKSAIGNLKSLRVPVRLGEAAFALVFEELVHRREKNAGTGGIDADVEVEFVVEKVDIAVAHHAEEFA